MNIITIDLGTTNIKVSAYNRALTPLTTLSHNVIYQRHNEWVEFDAEAWFDRIIEMVNQAGSAAKKINGGDVVQIVLTGQAESLVLLDGAEKVIRPAISWLDMRSRNECAELASVFNIEQGYQITGQPEIIPTWPITKMLWLNRHENETFKRTRYFLLLKDYIIFRLSGRMAGDYSIYSFSYYFNITQKTYWQEILDYCSVSTQQLPEVLPSCTLAGTLLTALTQTDCGLTPATKINVGTLDHFAGMIGTGNIQEGIISESAGTVLSLATLVSTPDFSLGRLPLNCGPFPDSYVLLPVCESGGFSLEWYKNTFWPEASFADINQAISEKNPTTPPVFLPYLTGVNAPEFDEHASGVFFGIHASHGKEDFALAIMQGVACLLRKNIEYMTQAGIKVNKIISVGGGAKSPLWNQIKSDFTHQTFEIPENEEAASFGAAIIGAVSEGYFPSFVRAVEEKIKIKHVYMPAERQDYEATWGVFSTLYAALGEVYVLNAHRR
ncbi:FGGY family carbohydrate kinase [Pantoea cypripedii]|uniref:FGGY-family carbohydrate kinase n=1 Tax=Pantoea cypripedii TaxID=55209 RepID=UPI002FCACC0F